MSELAIRPMSVAEFLRWEDGTDTRYELVSGFPVAMTPRAEAHRLLATRLVARIDAAVANGDPETHRSRLGSSGRIARIRISLPTSQRLVRPMSADGRRSGSRS